MCFANVGQRRVPRRTVEARFRISTVKRKSMALSQIVPHLLKTKSGLQIILRTEQPHHFSKDPKARSVIGHAIQKSTHDLSKAIFVGPCPKHKRGQISSASHSRYWCL